MANWIQAWVVMPDGTSVREVTASVAQFTVTVRERGQTRGGRQYDPRYFQTYFAPTREGAIDRFIAHHTEDIVIAQDHIKEAARLIRCAEQLREKT